MNRDTSEEETMMERKVLADATHDAWFRARVQAALNDPHPGIPQEEVEAYFAKRRADAARKVS